MRYPTLFACAALATTTACKETPKPTAEAEQATATPTAAAEQSVAAKGFDPASVAESGATLPEFPLFKPLDGLQNVADPKESEVAFDREHFVAGEEMIAVEGKIFRGKYPLEADRPYSSLEFRRNYEQAITQLGGKKIGGTIPTGAFRDQLEKANEATSGYCFSFACDEADFYLIRQGGKQYWIAVATGAIPLHGFVTVLEKAEMAKSYSFMDADALKAALDANGRVPVYIEFDIDRASIRPVARPAIDEIIKLMTQYPKLNVSIEGHTDDTGTATRNKPLSLARAEAVRAELIAAGIATARMRTAGYGSEKPLAQGSDDNARARNRRVELVRF